MPLINILFNVMPSREETYEFLEANMTIDKWIMLAEKDIESIIRVVENYNFYHMTHGDKWFELYKVIISKRPRYIRNIVKSRHIGYLQNGPRGSIDITDEQYDELCKLAGESYIAWQQELAERNEAIKNAKEEFLNLFE